MPRCADDVLLIEIIVYGSGTDLYHPTRRPHTATDREGGGVGGMGNEKCKQTRQFRIDLVPASRDPLTSYPLNNDDGTIHFLLAPSPPTAPRCSDARNAQFVERFNCYHHGNCCDVTDDDVIVTSELGDDVTRVLVVTAVARQSRQPRRELTL